MRARSPFVRDGIVAALVLVAALLCALGPKGHGITALGVLSGLAVCAPLAVRTLAPVAVLVATTVAMFAALHWLTPVPTSALAPMIALYTVARQRPPRTALVAAGAMLPVALVANALFSDHGLLEVETLKNLLMVGLPLLAGIAVRSHLDYKCAVQERMARAAAAREEEALRRVGEERLRIAREVHDVVAHAMVAINVQAGVAAHVVARRPEAALEALAEIKRVSGEALTDLRSTLGVLREPATPAPTSPVRGLGSIDELADGVRAAGLDVAVRRDVEPAVVPSAVSAAGYRIVQEALTNVLRHASAARRADVRLAVVADALEIEVVDDGRVAGEVQTAGSGSGLRGMHERAAAVGGEVRAGRRPEGGWGVLARLPLATGIAAGLRTPAPGLAK